MAVDLIHLPEDPVEHRSCVYGEIESVAANQRDAAEIWKMDEACEADWYWTCHGSTTPPSTFKFMRDIVFGAAERDDLSANGIKSHGKSEADYSWQRCSLKPRGAVPFPCIACQHGVGCGSPLKYRATTNRVKSKGVTELCGGLTSAKLLPLRACPKPCVGHRLIGLVYGASAAKEQELIVWKFAHGGIDACRRSRSQTLYPDIVGE